MLDAPELEIYLKENKCRLNTPDTTGNFLLHVLVAVEDTSLESMEAIDVVIAMDCIDPVGDMRMTPLMIASRDGKPKSAAKLLAANASLTTTDEVSFFGRLSNSKLTVTTAIWLLFPRE